MNPESTVLGIVYKIGSLSDVGGIRKNNEDSILVLESKTTYESIEQHRIVCAVADGVGGSQKGEVASRLALQTLATKASELVLQSSEKLAASLRASINEANEAVVKHGIEYPESEGLATTIVACILDGDALHVVHAGDSRAYLVSAEAIRQLTKDHSVVQELVDAGKITIEEARHHPERNIITNAVGCGSDIAVNCISANLVSSDAVLLCTDGLWDPVSDAEIQDTITKSSNPQSACEQLVALANQRGGRDNISLIIICREALKPSLKGRIEQERENLASKPIKKTHPSLFNSLLTKIKPRSTSADDRNVKETCVKCGGGIPKNSKFCDKCGANQLLTQQQTLELRCGECGRVLPRNAKFCDGCGAPQQVSSGASRDTDTVEVVDVRTCPKCASRLRASAKFCKICGVNVVETT